MKRRGYLITIALSIMLPLGEPTAAKHPPFNSPFDQYSNICWEDEKARLDNFAIALHNADPTTLGHIIVYDAKLSCRGEAVARAIRAKKYLVEYRGVDSARVVWRWGGYQNDINTLLIVTPRGASIWPFTPSLSRDEVTFIGNCYRRVRPVKCPKWDAPNKRLERTRR